MIEDKNHKLDLAINHDLRQCGSNTFVVVLWMVAAIEFIFSIVLQDQ